MYEAEGFSRVRKDSTEKQSKAPEGIVLGKPEMMKLALDQAIASESVEDITAGILRLTGGYREAVADDRNAIRFINEVETLVLKQRRAWLERVRRVCEIVLRNGAAPAFTAAAMIALSDIVYTVYHAGGRALLV